MNKLKVFESYVEASIFIEKLVDKKLNYSVIFLKEKVVIKYV